MLSLKCYVRVKRLSQDEINKWLRKENSQLSQKTKSTTLSRESEALQRKKNKKNKHKKEKRKKRLVEEESKKITKDFDKPDRNNKIISSSEKERNHDSKHPQFSTADKKKRTHLNAFRSDVCDRNESSNTISHDCGSSFKKIKIVNDNTTENIHIIIPKNKILNMANIKHKSNTEELIDQFDNIRDLQNALIMKEEIKRESSPDIVIIDNDEEPVIIDNDEEPRQKCNIPFNQMNEIDKDKNLAAGSNISSSKSSITDDGNKRTTMNPVQNLIDDSPDKINSHGSPDIIIEGAARNVLLQFEYDGPESSRADLYRKVKDDINIKTVIAAKDLLSRDNHISKISKMSEVLHLAIGDLLKKETTIENVNMIQSFELRNCELKRIDKDYKYLIKIRSFEFCPLFRAILSSDINGWEMVLVLYCKIVAWLIKVNFENINHVKNLKNIIITLFEEQRFRDDIVLNVFNLEKNEFNAAISVTFQLLELNYPSPSENIPENNIDQIQSYPTVDTDCSAVSNTSPQKPNTLNELKLIQADLKTIPSTKKNITQIDSNRVAREATVVSDITKDVTIKHDQMQVAVPKTYKKPPSNPLVIKTAGQSKPNNSLCKRIQILDHGNVSSDKCNEKKLQILRGKYNGPVAVNQQNIRSGTLQKKIACNNNYKGKYNKIVDRSGLAMPKVTPHERILQLLSLKSQSFERSCTQTDKVASVCTDLPTVDATLSTSNVTESTSTTEPVGSPSAANNTPTFNNLDTIVDSLKQIISEKIKLNNTNLKANTNVNLSLSNVSSAKKVINTVEPLVSTTNESLNMQDGGILTGKNKTLVFPEAAAITRPSKPLLTIKPVEKINQQLSINPHCISFPNFETSYQKKMSIDNGSPNVIDNVKNKNLACTNDVNDFKGDDSLIDSSLESRPVIENTINSDKSRDDSKNKVTGVEQTPPVFVHVDHLIRRQSEQRADFGVGVLSNSLQNETHVSSGETDSSQCKNKTSVPLLKKLLSTQFYGETQILPVTKTNDYVDRNQLLSTSDSKNTISLRVPEVSPTDKTKGNEMVQKVNSDGVPETVPNHSSITALTKANSTFDSPWSLNSIKEKCLQTASNITPTTAYSQQASTSGISTYITSNDSECNNTVSTNKTKPVVYLSKRTDNHLENSTMPTNDGKTPSYLTLFRKIPKPPRKVVGMKFMNNQKTLESINYSKKVKLRSILPKVNTKNIHSFVNTKTSSKDNFASNMTIKHNLPAIVHKPKKCIPIILTKHIPKKGNAITNQPSADQNSMIDRNKQTGSNEIKTVYYEIELISDQIQKINPQSAIESGKETEKDKSPVITSVVSLNKEYMKLLSNSNERKSETCELSETGLSAVSESLDEQNISAMLPVSTDSDVNLVNDDCDDINTKFDAVTDTSGSQTQSETDSEATISNESTINATEAYSQGSSSSDCEPNTRSDSIIDDDDDVILVEEPSHSMSMVAKQTEHVPAFNPFVITYPIPENFLNLLKNQNHKCGYEGCTRMLKLGIAVLFCSRCKEVGYCTMKCQRLHWYDSHRASCTTKQKDIVIETIEET